MNLGMGGVPKRSAFIIDKNGVIQYAESNDDARQLPNFEKIKAKLAGAEMRMEHCHPKRSRRIPQRYLRLSNGIPRLRSE